MMPPDKTLERLLKEILAEVKACRNEVRRHGTALEEVRKQLDDHEAGHGAAQ
jgi:hypothetical protein